MKYYPDLRVGIRNDYIYYKSLLNVKDEEYNKIGQKVNNYLHTSSILNDISRGKHDQRGIINKSLNFIRRLAELEEQKERAWLQAVSVKIGRKIEPNEDLAPIIAQLNEMVAENKDFLKNRLSKEIERLDGLAATSFYDLKANVNNSKTKAEWDERMRIFQNAVSQYRAIPEKIIGDLAQSISNYYKSSHKSYGRDIANMIAQRLWSSEKERNANPQWVNKVNAIAQQIAADIIYDGDYSYLSMSATQKKKAFEEWLSQEENSQKLKEFEESQYTQFFQSEALRRPTKQLSEDEAYKYAMKRIRANEQQMKKEFLALKNQDGRDRKAIRGDKLKKEFEAYQKHQIELQKREILKITKTTISIANYDMSEQITVADLARLGITAGARPTKRPKEDVIHTMISYDVSYLSDSQRQEITDLINKYENDAALRLAALVDTMGGGKDAYTKNRVKFEQYAKQNLQMLRDLRTEIERITQETEQLITQYDVLTSVKAQDTIASYKMADTGNGMYTLTPEGGFKAGALSSNNNALDLINTIIKHSAAAGIKLGKDTIEWLRMSLLNSGKGLLGSDNKTVLEHYFSIFVSMLMFSDSEYMVSQMVDQKAKEVQEMVSIKRVHLLKLNTTYVPLSTILYRVYNELYPLLEQQYRFAYFQGNGSYTARVSLDVYNVGNKDPGNTYEDWQRESQMARDQAKIRVFFLANFSDLLKQINAALKQ